MRLLNSGYYTADNGKHFVLTEKGKENCASWHHKSVGDPVDSSDYMAVGWAVDKGYLIEVPIKGWTKLKGYEVVYYHYGCRLHAGNAQTFPTRKLAEACKKHYESYAWFHEDLVIEEVEYEGVPLSENKMLNGKKIIDSEHYFGLDLCEEGDYFTEKMVDEFMNSLPPACMRSDCSQIGEPTSHRPDETGILKPTYATFKRIADGIWEYCGDCFEGENVKR